jgi:uncharacterized protein (TIGR02597 family)
MQKANHARGLRFLSKLAFITTVGLISAAIAYQAPAQTVVTDPVGFITLTATGATTTAGLYNFWSLGMVQVPVLRGLTTQITGKQVTLDQALSPGQYNESNTVGSAFDPSYFVEFTSGPYAGLMDDIVSNDAAAIYTASDDSGQEAAGVTYKIYPHWTIGLVFGPQNQAGLNGGANGGAADEIEVWNPTSQGFVNYYYKTTTSLGGSGWRSTANTSINVSNTVLYIDQGFEVERRTAAGNVNLLLVGAVKLSNTISVVYGTNSAGLGFTLAGNVFPAGIPLGTSGLYTGNSATGLNGGANGGAADEVQVWNPNTQGYTFYYYKTTTSLGGSGWRSTANTSIDCSTNQLPLGDIVKIQRRIKGSFNWTMPQPFVQ